MSNFTLTVFTSFPRLEKEIKYIIKITINKYLTTLFYNLISIKCRKELKEFKGKNLKVEKIKIKNTYYRYSIPYNILNIMLTY